MKCGGKWGRGHKYPDQIPLHIMEEVLDAMSIEDTSTDEQEHLDSSSDEEVLSLSWSAHEGIQGRKTIRLQGLINNQEILLLVDSGSSSTFISAAVVHRLQFQTEEASEVQVTVADGTQMTIKQIVKDITWWT